MNKQMLPFLLFVLFGVNAFSFLYFFLFKTYPLVLLMVHFFSLVILWIWVEMQDRLFYMIKTHKKDLLLIAVLCVIAFLIRIYNIDIATPGMWGDEISVAIAGEKTFLMHAFLPYIPDYIGHPTPLLYLVGLSMHFFGKTVIAIRLQSILFGVLDVAIMYIFLRQLFTKQTSFVTSLLLTFSYSHLVLSRFAYDMTAAIFFQILAIFFLYRAYIYKTIHHFVGIALSLGMGLFTYYSFRSFTILFVILTFLCIFSQGKKDWIKKTTVFISVLFISSILLASYDLRNSNDLLARTKALSVFNQGFSQTRLIGELGGNIRNDAGALFFVGDPTPRQNPSQTSLFDIFSTVLYFVGVGIVYKKNKLFFFISLLFVVFALINDVFTVEIFPEFHFYGTGHPNLLRISGIIPIVYFWIAYAFNWLETMQKKIQAMYFYWFYTLGTVIILLFNWLFYFNQPVYWSMYNYKFNGARMIRIANFINSSSEKNIAVSPAFLHDERVLFFVNPDKKLTQFTLGDGVASMHELNQQNIAILDPEENTTLVESIVDEFAKTPTYSSTILTSPFGTTDAVIISKNN